MKKKKIFYIQLSLPRLHKDVIAEYIKKAESLDYDQIDFTFGAEPETKVHFVVDVENNSCPKGGPHYFHQYRMKCRLGK